MTREAPKKETKETTREMTRGDDDLVRKLAYLKIKGLDTDWDEYIAAAQRENMSHERFLRHVVDRLHDSKQTYGRQMRFKRARITEVWEMATYPFAKQPKLKRSRILNIYDSMDYMTKNRNVVFMGPTGVGKTGLATSLLINAINNGYTGYFTSFPDLIESLFKSMAAHREDQLVRRYASYDCLQIDELGYVDVEKAQIGLFFKLMSMRHNRRTTLLTTNLGFADWPEFLKNERLAAALVDRLTSSSHVINMKGCVSLRARLDVEGNPIQ